MFLSVNYSIEYLDLSGNELVGVIPSEIGQCLKLTNISFGNNTLTGDVGSIINMLPRILTKLNLDDNRLNGTVPSSIGNFANLEWLHLGGNNLNGTIPTELGLLSNLEALGLNSNQLTGTVPTSLARLPRLGKSQSHSSTVLPLLVLTCVHPPHYRAVVPL
jgi:Leucine-rich repeat (LRR) protein